MENELKSILKESIYTITKNSDLFCSELNFNKVLAYELKKELKRKNKEYDTLIEYCTLSCYSEKKEDMLNYYIDIVIKNDNEFYPILLKYSGFKGKECIGGTTGGELALAFVKDIEILQALRESIQKETPTFTKGFCILLTNEDYILKPSNYVINNVYKDFVISPETKTIGGKTLYYHKEEVKIEKYDLEWYDKITESKNFKDFRFLIVEVPGKKL